MFGTLIFKITNIDIELSQTNLKVEGYIRYKIQNLYLREKLIFKIFKDLLGKIRSFRTCWTKIESLKDILHTSRNLEIK